MSMKMVYSLSGLAVSSGTPRRKDGQPGANAPLSARGRIDPDARAASESVLDSFCGGLEVDPDHLGNGGQPARRAPIVVRLRSFRAIERFHNAISETCADQPCAAG